MPRPLIACRAEAIPDMADDLSLTIAAYCADTGYRENRMTHRPDAGEYRRIEGARMAEKEWVVPIAPVRDADRMLRAFGLPDAPPQREGRVTELRQLVLGGYYASDAMMAQVARYLYASGDL